MKHLKSLSQFDINEKLSDKDKNYRIMTGTIIRVRRSHDRLDVVYQNSKSKIKSDTGVSIPLKYFEDSKNPLPKEGDKCSGKFYGGDSDFGSGKIIYFCWAGKYCWEPN
jgi:hypothetical protein